MIIAVDVLVKTMLDAALADYRANAWILDDVFGGLARDPLSSSDFGYKEVETAKNWFLDNDIPVLLQYRIADDPPLPCITVAYGPDREMLERTNLADEGLVEQMDPSEFRKPQKIVGNFTPKSYSQQTGTVTLPENLTTRAVAEGQFLVSSVSGKAYVIQKLLGESSFNIAPNTNDDFTDAYVAPAVSLWNLHRELTFLHHTIQIEVHANNNPGQTMWLWQLVIYSLLRYKEAFLEGRGFVLSTMSSSPLMRNPQFAGENIFTKQIVLEGQVQADWIKFVAPKLGKVSGGIAIIGPKAPPGTYPKGVDVTWKMSGDYQYGRRGKRQRDDDDFDDEM